MPGVGGVLLPQVRSFFEADERGGFCGRFGRWGPAVLKFRSVEGGVCAAEFWVQFPVKKNGWAVFGVGLPHVISGRGFLGYRVRECFPFNAGGF